MGSEEHWWAVARSEEVTGKKPLNVDIDNQPIVLWRDAEGMARALEDRCPHRRAPLSLGCIRSEGWIQCGYHGWSFDGETGRLKEIPNMKDKQSYPPLYKAIPFAVQEDGGFIRVRMKGDSIAPAPQAITLPFSGTENVALDHRQYLDALFDDPSLIIAIRGVRFTPYLMTELKEQDGLMVLERNCQWASPHWPSPFSSDFPLTLLIATDPATGESELLLRDDSFNELLVARMAPVPGARGVTQVRWRAKVGARRDGLMAKQLGIGNPFKVLPNIDGAALRVLKPSVSIHAGDLRSKILENASAATAKAA